MFKKKGRSIELFFVDGTPDGMVTATILNRLRRLEQKRFGDLNLREREHLQEWLAHQPDALGEELLILQKEFDGFADTRERLDLLARDKDGQLVVVENKLDDSGRDVTWQALKYTAYVSSLTKAQIIDIFQQYLDRHMGGGNAARLICEFLEVDELDEVVLNPGHSQRLIFIAANFRKEVTSTVLWLREHQIDARCFKVTPFVFGAELLLDIQPVIPTPEAADFMIGMAEKESEEKSAKGTQQKRHKLRYQFWDWRCRTSVQLASVGWRRFRLQGRTGVIAARDSEPSSTVSPSPSRRRAQRSFSVAPTRIETRPCSTRSSPGERNLTKPSAPP